MADGRFWMFFWLFWLVMNVIWAVVTMVTSLRSSTVNLNALSLEALLLACGGGFQASLGMRKADDEDPL